MDRAGLQIEADTLNLVEVGHGNSGIKGKGKLMGRRKPRGAREEHHWVLLFLLWTADRAAREIAEGALATA